MKKLIAILAVLALMMTACSSNNEADTTPVDQRKSQVLFRDDFSDSSSGWDQATSGYDSTDYADGKYRIYIEAPQQDVWTNPYQYFDQDVVIDVDAEHTVGTTKSDYGVICGYVDASNFHALTIGSDGFIEIFKYLKGERFTLFSEEGNNAILKSSNHLTAKCIGTTLTLLVNGTQIAQVQDADLVRGDVGLIAGSFEEGNLEFLFDNFVVTAAE
ncbi:MAG: hypothetical protein WA116_03600 [Anaerolineaceae bacterium]